jgi:1-acyl-sn-glycerol-3-phosphate acyltransferase
MRSWRSLANRRFPFRPPDWPATVERPVTPRPVGLDYDHEWSRRYPARLMRAILLDNVTRPLIRLVAPMTLRGVEHLAYLEPPVIFVANHASHLDTPLLLSVLPPRFRHRTVVGAAADYFFDRPWKGALWSLTLAAIPIERARVNRRSAETATALLQERWNLIIFPEGGRSPDGWAQEFRGGAAYLAVRNRAAVVPVYLHGTRHILPKRNRDAPGGSGTENRGRPLRRSPVLVLFGLPLRPDGSEDARRFALRIEHAVALLAAEAATDWWSARRKDDAQTALHGPQVAPWRRAWAERAPGGPQQAWPGRPTLPSLRARQSSAGGVRRPS